MVNKNIIKIRKKLDKLDDKLLDIIKIRSRLVDLVIENKIQRYYRQKEFLKSLKI